MTEHSSRRVANPSKGGADRRRVAIMQTTPTTPSALRSRRAPKSDLAGLALVAPPDAAPTTYTQQDNGPTSSPMLSPITPAIGQAKDIHIPVAGPVVVNLGSQATNSPPPDTPASSSSQLGVQLNTTDLGVQSLAGPLRTISPPPRPPRLQSPKRDLDAVRQALQLSPSVTTILCSKSSSDLTSYSDLLDVDSKSEVKPSSVHRREGAFAPLEDSVMGSDSTSNMENKKTAAELLDTADIPSVTVVEPLSRPHTLPARIDHHKFSEWLKSNPELSLPLSSPIDEALHKQNLSESMSSDSGGSEAPSPPPKSFRNGLTANIRRLSLPRTASLSSKSVRRWSGGGTQYSSRTPSPRFQKIRSTNPAALFCHEVHSQRTTAERCLIYANKINELHLYDCGLSEWVINMKSRGPNTQRPRAPSTQPFTPQPRHISRSSMISEATFPRRSDASLATDLSQGAYGEITPTAVSLTLPYPYLAMNPPRTNPSRSNSNVGTPASSIRSLVPSTSISKSGGFFASLGRRASLSKKERPNIPSSSSSSSGSLPSALGSGRTSSKHTASPLINVNISRPINMISPPSVPGGPRAPPRRPQRSHTITPSFPPASVASNSDLGRRPSMFDLALDPVVDIHTDTE